MHLLRLSLICLPGFLLVLIALPAGVTAQTASSAILVAEPPQAAPGDQVTLIGADFQAGERISFWITLPDGKAEEMFSGITADGTFAVEYRLPALPAGRHHVTAYGQSSDLTAIEALVIVPGGHN